MVLPSDITQTVVFTQYKEACIKSSRKEHLQIARTERKYYNSQVKAASRSQEAASQSQPRVAHYSYDFAQQIHYPFSAQQTGPEYFKTARKCGLFGVCNDARLFI